MTAVAEPRRARELECAVHCHFGCPTARRVINTAYQPRWLDTHADLPRNVAVVATLPGAKV